MSTDQPPPPHPPPAPRDDPSAAETVDNEGSATGSAPEHGDPVTHGASSAGSQDRLEAHFASAVGDARLETEVERLRQSQHGSTPTPPPPGDRSPPVEQHPQDLVTSEDSTGAVAWFGYEGFRELAAEHGFVLPPSEIAEPATQQLHHATEATPESESLSGDQMNHENPHSIEAAPERPLPADTDTSPISD